MREKAPAGFDIDAFFKGVYLFQEWEIFPGSSTKGPKNLVEHMQLLKAPDRFDNLQVLDIAPWNGFFSFECVRRGAAFVTSLGPDDPDKTGYNAVRELLGIKNCKYVRASVYDLNPEVHGTFDVVLFLGLIHHLRHLLLALDRIWEVTKKQLFTDSPTIDDMVFDQTVTEDQRKAILAAGKTTNQLPMVYFTKGAETRDPFNWFIANRKAFRDFVESSGFVIDHSFDDGGWSSIAATKGARPFIPGLEGWNEKAAIAQSGRPEMSGWRRRGPIRPIRSRPGRNPTDALILRRSLA